MIGERAGLLGSKVIVMIWRSLNASKDSSITFLCKRCVICVLLSLFNFCLSKPGDASSHQRVYLKDLRMTKVIKGTDIQVYHTQFASTLEMDLANVVEF